MKQLSFITILTLLAFTTAQGQVLRSVGIKSGLSVANQTRYYKLINSTLEMDKRIGFTTGLSFEFLNSKYLNLLADISYCQKGYSEGRARRLDTRFDYLVINPMLKLKYELNQLTPYLLAGPRLDYQVSYKSDTDLQQVDQYFVKTIWGMTTGLGLEFKLNNIGIFTEAQYHFDFTKFMDVEPVHLVNTGISIKNQAYLINLGLKYYFGKAKS